MSAQGPAPGRVGSGDGGRSDRSGGRRIKAWVFDAYGTLYDVHSVVEACEQLWPGHGSALSQAWRSKQLETTWQRSLMERYAPFDEITADSLRVACAALGLTLHDAEFALLMQTYLQLRPFPEVRAALAQLSTQRARPVTLAILSNGSPAMLDPLVQASGLSEWIGTVISVDAVHIYKPAPQVYQLAVDRLQCAPIDIGFVSSNCWDACGAKSFGFNVFWVNRSSAPLDALGVEPDHIVESLSDLPALAG